MAMEGTDKERQEFIEELRGTTDPEEKLMLRILLMDEEEQNQICSMIDRELSGLSERQTQPGRNKTAMTEEAPIELFAILDEIREKYGITDEEWAKGAGMSLNGVETFRQMALGQKKVH